MSEDTYTLEELADALAGGNLRRMARMINDALGGGEQIDEVDPAADTKIPARWLLDLADTLPMGNPLRRKISLILDGEL